MTGPSFGSWAKIVTSTLTTRQPRLVQPAQRLAAGSRRESRVLVGRVGVGVGVADVAEAGGAEQGVGHGVQHDVGVAVAGQAARVLDADAAEDQRPALGRGGACRGRCRRACRAASASRSRVDCSATLRVRQRDVAAVNAERRARRRSSRSA